MNPSRPHIAALRFGSAVIRHRGEVRPLGSSPLSASASCNLTATNHRFHCKPRLWSHSCGSPYHSRSAVVKQEQEKNPCSARARCEQQTELEWNEWSAARLRASCNGVRRVTEPQDRSPLGRGLGSGSVGDEESNAARQPEHEGPCGVRTGPSPHGANDRTAGRVRNVAEAAGRGTRRRISAFACGGRA